MSFFIDNRSRIHPFPYSWKSSVQRCLSYSNNPTIDPASLIFRCRDNVTIHKTIDPSSKLWVVIETRRTGERGARVEEPRAWSDVTRRSRARERDRPANPNEGEDRERGRRRKRERKRERKRIDTRASKDTRPRENGDTRATRAAVPLQLNHSKLPPLAELPPPHAHHVVLNPPVDPPRRPLTTRSSSLALALLPSIVYHSFSLPFVAPTISILFYFVIPAPRRSTPAT